jgi:galactokinase
MPKPVDILVTGSVPAGSGLSSSAAMVVASTLAFLAVNEKITTDLPEGGKHTLTKGELVEMAVENEKRVGVNSGGCVIISVQDPAKSNELKKDGSSSICDIPSYVGAVHLLFPFLFCRKRRTTNYTNRPTSCVCMCKLAGDIR